MGSMFHFVAGEQHIQFSSCSYIDAFMKFQRHMKKNPVAGEFLEKPIEVYDSAGNLLDKRSWKSLAELVMKDTYGPNWRQAVDGFHRDVGHNFYGTE